MTIDSREFGQAEAKIEQLQQISKEIQAEVREVRAALGKLENTMAEARGAWRSIAWAAGVVGAILGSLLNYLFTHMTGKA